MYVVYISLLVDTAEADCSQYRPVSDVTVLLLFRRSRSTVKHYVCLANEKKREVSFTQVEQQCLNSPSKARAISSDGKRTSFGVTPECFFYLPVSCGNTWNDFPAHSTSARCLIDCLSVHNPLIYLTFHLICQERGVNEQTRTHLQMYNIQ